MFWYIYDLIASWFSEWSQKLNENEEPFADVLARFTANFKTLTMETSVKTALKLVGKDLKIIRFTLKTRPEEFIRWEYLEGFKLTEKTHKNDEENPTILKKGETAPMRDEKINFFKLIEQTHTSAVYKNQVFLKLTHEESFLLSLILYEFY